jgi:hypothetical protein
LMQGNVDDVRTGVVGLGGRTASRVITVRPGLLSAIRSPRTTCLQLSYNNIADFQSESPEGFDGRGLRIAADEGVKPGPPSEGARFTMRR